MQLAYGFRWLDVHNGMKDVVRQVPRDKNLNCTQDTKNIHMKQIILIFSLQLGM